MEDIDLATAVPSGAVPSGAVLVCRTDRFYFYLITSGRYLAFGNDGEYIHEYERTDVSEYLKRVSNEHRSIKWYI